MKAFAILAISLTIGYFVEATPAAGFVILLSVLFLCFGLINEEKQIRGFDDV